MFVTPAELRELKDYVYQLYVEAGTPPVQHIATEIENDDTFSGSPSKATVHRIIGSEEVLAGQEDVVSVAVLLARKAGRDAGDVTSRVKNMWVAARLAKPLGALVGDLDPFALEVHRAITVPGQESLPTLPIYVERDHDVALSEAVERAVRGESLLVTLIGESSTGKTRACWEALRRLPEGWRVWHPYDPTRPDAALDHIGEVGPRTVIWLNEAQHYLLTPDAKTAERITAALRTALCDRRRGPLLVLATMWPRFWDPLTAPSATGSDDPFEQQRKLLTGTGQYIVVPKAFTDSDMRQARKKAESDSRLASALVGAVEGEITQFLAGVPELMSRYRCAPPGAMALIHAAMDYRRLGHGPAMPRALLAEAAEGYLTDRELGWLGDDWLDVALRFCGKPCHGVLGPLTKISRKGDDVEEPAYRLADYLEQQGRLDRRLLCPPASFWEAAARHCYGHEDRAALARAAESRGRLRAARILYEEAVASGNTDLRPDLARLLEGTGDAERAIELYEAAWKADGRARWELVRLREILGKPGKAEDLANDAARQGDTTALIRLARLRQAAGDDKNAERLMRAAAARGEINTFAELARSREGTGDRTGAEEVAFLALNRVGSTYALSELVRVREKAGDGEGAERLVWDAVARGKVRPAVMLARTRERAGDSGSAERLLDLAARSGSRFAMVEQARLRKRAGDSDGAERLLRAAVCQGSTTALTELARLREKVGDADGALRLYRTAAQEGSTDALAALALLREEAGDSEEAERMACRAADDGSTFALLELVWLREKTRDQQGAERLAETAQRTGNTGALVLLARLREEAGDKEGAERLVLRAAQAGHSLALNEFVLRREAGGDSEGAERLASAGGSQVVTQLARLREGAGRRNDAERLYGLAAELGETRALGELARLKEEAEDYEAADELTREAAHAGHVEAFSALARLRANRGRLEDADRLYRTAADAGYGEALSQLAELRKRWDPDWEKLLRYGLTADGHTSQPW
ncbi:hypothetical protein ABT174_05415 [Streptomyces sparsogenes]|uniref:hypothetical protein n=1 Tax=Streptomyces sparsogenes TaxID=67365 RepID=UPI003321F254